MELIDKSALVAEIEKRINDWTIRGKNSLIGQGKDTCESRVTELNDLLSFLNTLEVKEVNIASMADEYYDALMKETVWMDEGTMCHCRLAYYNGCKDVLNKLQKGE